MISEKSKTNFSREMKVAKKTVAFSRIFLAKLKLVKNNYIYTNFSREIKVVKNLNRA